MGTAGSKSREDVLVWAWRNLEELRQFANQLNRVDGNNLVSIINRQRMFLERIDDTAARATASREQSILTAAPKR